VYSDKSLAAYSGTGRALFKGRNCPRDTRRKKEVSVLIHQEERRIVPQLKVLLRERSIASNKKKLPGDVVAGNWLKFLKREIIWEEK